MTDLPIHFSAGLPETVLDREPAAALDALAAALAHDDVGARRDAISTVVARWPRFLDGWGRLAEHGRDDIESYAAARVGYHRGLDRLRANGWRGSGYVRWAREENRGFLRSLDSLRRAAEAIGEDDEAERCALFLDQLDPSWPPAERGASAGL